jgi:hypothetical protein
LTTDLTNYAESELADHVCGVASFTAPSNVYVKLHTGAAGEDATLNAATETTRIEITFGAASGGVATNNANVEWTTLAASETLTHYSVWDASTSGNPLAVGALGSSVTVSAGGDFTIPSGQLTVTFQPAGVTNYLRDALLDHLLATSALTHATDVYVKLHGGAPGLDADQNAATETTREAAVFAAASGGVATTSTDSQWTSVSTTEDYTHYSVWDASSGGNPYFLGAFPETYSLQSGGDFAIPAGAMTVTFT